MVTDWRELPYIEPIPESGCLVWTAGVDKDGYARSRWGRSNTGYLHREIWKAENGPIPDGLVIDHKCRVRSCINPEHLRAVTPRENSLASGSLAPSKLNADKTKCPSCGGDFEVYWNYGDKERRCRSCFNNRTKLYQREMRAQRRMAGLCVQCAQKNDSDSLHCEACLAAARERYRKLYG